jgi:hypothetical protein
MIWAFEYLNEKQIEELNYLNPMMDFQYDFDKQMYYWKTFCAGFEKICDGEKNKYTENNNISINDLPKDENGYPILNWYKEVPVKDIYCYPNEKECIDNISNVFDSYDFILDKIKSNKFNFVEFNPIKVIYKNNNIYTIDKSRLLAFIEAVKLGYNEYEKIPVRFVTKLEKEIRRIRLFSLPQVRQGFICDDWLESINLCGYLKKKKGFKEIEENYKWIRDYLELRTDNIWLDIIAIPVSIYLNYFSENDESLELIDLNCLLERF